MFGTTMMSKLPNDSMLARSHLTEDFGCEGLPTPVCKELKTLEKLMIVILVVATQCRVSKVCH